MPAGDGSVVALDLFAAAAPAVVEVAVDAPGASRTYDYSVPDRLGPVLPGEAVLVEFGRQRQALGIVLGPSANVAGAVLKPLLARVHAGGPLVPPLTLAFARWGCSSDWNWSPSWRPGLCVPRPSRPPPDTSPPPGAAMPPQNLPPSPAMPRSRR